MLFRVFRRVWKMCSKNSGLSLSNKTDVKQNLSALKSEDNSDILYEKAITTLNSIQLQKISNGQRKDTQGEKFRQLKDICVDKYDQLAVIHVAGTKGKGSVCAFCESILRNCGYKTGFYSSPHLFEVRERLRINGKPISKELFTQYFWECWENFEIQKTRYGTFLVFMAFHVFLKEKVDVAIIEVGCGGEYDSTNVLRHPVVCGITLLDKDHLNYLGGSVESIAWHKAGIFKPGVPAFTVPQDSVSMKVLTERAKERQTFVKIVPADLPQDEDNHYPVLGIEGKHQFQNASLAVHLCQTWIQHRNTEKVINLPHQNENELLNTFLLPESFKEGLAKASWPGRTQCIEKENLTFYLDGAHTRKSIEACTEWFCEKSSKERLIKSEKKMSKILMFNFKGERNAESLLGPLVKCDFDYVVFCPNILNNEPISSTSDISDFSQDIELDKKKCYMIQEVWREVSSNHSSSEDTACTSNFQVFPCVSEAFHWIIGNEITYSTDYKTFHDIISCADHVQVFVTGSLYLVGMVLQLLDNHK